jgi:hypothetical protein
MLDWTASAGGSTYTYRAAFVPWIAAAAVVALAGLVAMLIGGARWRRSAALAGAAMAAPMMLALLGLSRCSR